MSQSHTDAVRSYLLGLQDRIISTFEAEDGKPFVRDAWVRGAHERLQGDGCSRLVEEGHVLERGGCNFSHVKGPACRPRQRNIALSWRAAPSRPWACRWCSTRAAHTSPPCT